MCPFNGQILIEFRENDVRMRTDLWIGAESVKVAKVMEPKSERKVFARGRPRFVLNKHVQSPTETMTHGKASFWLTVDSSNGQTVECEANQIRITMKVEQLKG
jgi:hypothetical protein